MADESLSYGLPKSLVDHQEKEFLKTLYGNFAIGVLEEFRQSNPDLPFDAVTIGDNWLQLVETHDDPAGQMQSLFASMGATTFGDMWPLMDRAYGEGIKDLVGQLAAGVAAGSLDDRILGKLAVIDRTSLANSIDVNELDGIQQTEWGIKGKMKSQPETEVFLIQKGFSRQTPEDLKGGLGDDFSVTAHWYTK